MKNLYFDEFLLEVYDNRTLKVKYEFASERVDVGDSDMEESRYEPLVIQEREQQNLGYDIIELKKGKLTGHNLENFGDKIYEKLFPGEIGAMFEQAIKKVDAHREERGLRIIVAYTEQSPVASWPLETLHCPSLDIWLATDKRLSFCRKIGRKFESFEKKHPLKILVVVSSPKKKAQAMSLPILEKLMEWAHSTPARSSMEESVRMRQPKTRSEEEGNESAPIEVQVLGQVANFAPADPDDASIFLNSPAGYSNFQQKVDAWKPQVLHFIGHGDVQDGQGRLAFVNPLTSLAEWVTAKQFSQLVGPGSSLRLVMLQVCKSADPDVQLSLATTMVGLNIPAVVAMQFEIDNYCAIEFSSHFYQALAQSKDVDYAVQLARHHITQVAHPVTKRPLFWNNREFCTPVVYTIKPGTIIDTSPVNLQSVHGPSAINWPSQRPPSVGIKGSAQVPPPKLIPKSD